MYAMRPWSTQTHPIPAKHGVFACLRPLITHPCSGPAGREMGCEGQFQFLNVALCMHIFWLLGHIPSSFLQVFVCVCMRMWHHSLRNKQCALRGISIHPYVWFYLWSKIILSTLICFIPAGRVVSVASVAGRVTAAYMSAYCASKYAVEGFNDVLRWVAIYRGS